MASSAAAATTASASTAAAIASTPSDVLAATSDEPGVKGAIRIINVPSAAASDASCAPYGPPNRKMAFALRGIEDPSGKHIVVLAHLTATADAIIAAIADNIGLPIAEKERYSIAIGKKRIDIGRHIYEYAWIYKDRVHTMEWSGVARAEENSPRAPASATKNKEKKTAAAVAAVSAPKEKKTAATPAAAPADAPKEKKTAATPAAAAAAPVDAPKEKEVNKTASSAPAATAAAAAAPSPQQTKKRARSPSPASPAAAAAASTSGSDSSPRATTEPGKRKRKLSAKLMLAYGIGEEKEEKAPSTPAQKQKKEGKSIRKKVQQRQVQSEDDIDEEEEAARARRYWEQFNTQLLFAWEWDFDKNEKWLTMKPTHHNRQIVLQRLVENKRDTPPEDEEEKEFIKWWRYAFDKSKKDKAPEVYHITGDSEASDEF